MSEKRNRILFIREEDRAVMVLEGLASWVEFRPADALKLAAELRELAEEILEEQKNG